MLLFKAFRQKLNSIRGEGLILISLACLTAPACADALADVDSLLQEASKENGEQNYSDAESHLRQALSLAVHNVGGMSSVAGKACRQLGEFFMNRSRYGDAEHYLQRSLVIASGYSGAMQDSEGEFQNTRQFVSDAVQNPTHLLGSLDVANALSSLADLRSREGKYDDAVRLLKRCVQIYGDAGHGGGSALNYLPNSKQVLAEHQRSLAQALYKNNAVLEAEEAFKSYVETVRKDKGNSPELAEALSHLSAFYKSQNRSSEADATEAEAREMQNSFH